MTQLQVVRVQSRGEKKQFLSLPWQLYRNDPHWIPPLRMNQKELVGFKKHPFHEVAEVQTFLALRDGRPVGRVAGIINHVHNDHYSERRGFFGFFESVEEQVVVDALFDDLRRWLKEHEIVDLRGPVNPSLNYECGLLVEGFHSPPTFMMTYNHPYYGGLLESYGFRKVEDMVAFWGHIEMLEGLDKKMAFISAEAKRRFDIRLRPIDKGRFLEDVRTWLDVYNQSLVGTWGFTPLSEGEISHMSHALRQLIVPELTTVAEIDGQMVGAVFALLDYNPRIKKIDGRLLPFGFIRLLANRRAIKKIRVISTNVIPKFQRWGVGLVLLGQLVPAILEYGIQEVEFSWVLESNHLSYKTLKKGGAKLDKTYRIYDLDREVVGSP